MHIDSMLATGGICPKYFIRWAQFHTAIRVMTYTTLSLLSPIKHLILTVVDLLNDRKLECRLLLVELFRSWQSQRVGCLFKTTLTFRSLSHSHVKIGRNREKPSHNSHYTPMCILTIRQRPQ